jgi:hypothetical protein
MRCVCVLVIGGKITEKSANAMDTSQKSQRGYSDRRLFIGLAVAAFIE